MFCGCQAWPTERQGCFKKQALQPDCLDSDPSSGMIQAVCPWWDDLTSLGFDFLIHNLGSLTTARVTVLYEALRAVPGHSASFQDKLTIVIIFA